MEEQEPLIAQQFGYRRLYFSVFVACCGTLGMGSCLGYSSPAIPSLQSNSSKLIINDEEASWFGSLMAIGALIGCLIAGFTVERFGRRTSLFISSIPFIGGWLIISMANSIKMLYIGRIITGACTGMASIAVPLFISESSPPEVRGLLGTCMQITVNIGILWAYCLGLALDWSYLAFASVFFPTLLLIFVTCIPETPRWLIMHNEYSKAVESVSFSFGPHYDAEAQCRDIQNSLNIQENVQVPKKDFCQRENIIPVLLLIGLMFFQQFSGINNVILYTVSIFQSAGINFNSNILSVILGVVLLISTIASSVLIDCTGRKPLLLISGCGMGIAFFFLGLFYYFKSHQEKEFTDNYGWLAITSVLFYIIMFAIGYGPIPWCMLGELVPAKIGGIASSASTLTNWSCAFIVCKLFNTMLQSMHEYGTYWFFSSICILAAFFVILLPETKGKTLEQISEHFKKSE